MAASAAQALAHGSPPRRRVCDAALGRARHRRIHAARASARTNQRRAPALLAHPPRRNRTGRCEGWGSGRATKVAEVSTKIPTTTGAQLKELLKKLPEGMTFELNLEKEDD